MTGMTQTLLVNSCDGLVSCLMGLLKADLHRDQTHYKTWCLINCRLPVGTHGYLLCAHGNQFLSVTAHIQVYRLILMNL